MLNVLHFISSLKSLKSQFQTNWLADHFNTDITEITGFHNKSTTQENQLIHMPCTIVIFKESSKNLLCPIFGRV